MSDEISAILALPYLLASQAQKHVTHNEALQLLDALVQLRVSAFDAETPPLSPSLGDAYALGALPSGARAGQASPRKTRPMTLPAPISPPVSARNGRLLGVMGKLRRGQPCARRWRQMQGISDQLEEWLLR